MASAWGASWSLGWGASWGSRAITSQPRRRRILHARYWKRNQPDGARQEIEARLQTQHDIAQEVSANLAREFLQEEQAQVLRIEAMSQAQIDAEIGVLLRKKLHAQEQEMLTILAVVASVV